MKTYGLIQRDIVGRNGTTAGRERYDKPCLLRAKIFQNFKRQLRLSNDEIDDAILTFA